MDTIVNLTASGRSISDAERIVRKAFMAKHAVPQAMPTPEQEQAKFERARKAVRRALKGGPPATTEFHDYVQAFVRAANTEPGSRRHDDIKKPAGKRKTPLTVA
ncbi:MAG: hypothetical protein ABIT83_25900 [Massilia sp.]